MNHVSPKSYRPIVAWFFWLASHQARSKLYIERWETESMSWTHKKSKEKSFNEFSASPIARHRGGSHLCSGALFTNYTRHYIYWLYYLKRVLHQTYRSLVSRLHPIAIIDSRALIGSNVEFFFIGLLFSKQNNNGKLRMRHLLVWVIWFLIQIP